MDRGCRTFHVHVTKLIRSVTSDDSSLTCLLKTRCGEILGEGVSEITRRLVSPTPMSNLTQPHGQSSFLRRPIPSHFLKRPLQLQRQKQIKCQDQWREDIAYRKPRLSTTFNKWVTRWVRCNVLACFGIQASATPQCLNPISSSKVWPQKVNTQRKSQIMEHSAQVVLTLSYEPQLWHARNEKIAFEISWLHLNKIFTRLYKSLSGFTSMMILPL